MFHAESTGVALMALLLAHTVCTGRLAWALQLTDLTSGPASAILQTRRVIGSRASHSMPNDRQMAIHAYPSVDFDVLDGLVQASRSLGTIPHVLHQNYMGGKAALDLEVLKPEAYFRRHWWRSCQVSQYT